MVDMLLNAMIAAIIGTVAFVVTKNVLASQDTTSWSSLENAIMPLVPSALAIILLIGIFMGVTKIRSV